MITGEEWRRANGSDGGKFDRQMRMYEEAKVALANLEEEVYRPAHSARNAVAKRISDRRGQLRYLATQLEVTEQRLAKAREAKERRQDPLAKLREIRDSLGIGGSAA